MEEEIVKYSKMAVKAYKEVGAAGLTPRVTDNFLQTFTGYRAFVDEELGTIQIQKPAIWMKLRRKEKCNSDKMADMLWDTTKLGQREIVLSSQTKILSSIISALKARLKRFDNEQYGGY